MMGTPEAGMSRAGMAAETANLAEATAARRAVTFIFGAVLWDGADKESSPTASRSPRHRYLGTGKSAAC